MRKQGISKDKFCKGTDIPKRSGNYSPTTIHFQSLQVRDYKVRLIDGHLIVGERTPLTEIFKPDVVMAILNDRHFNSYRQEGVKTINGKRYETHRILTKYDARFSYLNEIKYLLREEIYTDFDFDYNFKEY